MPHPLMRKGTPPLPTLLSFSNLGTIEVRFQVGADVFPLEALGIEPRASHILSTTELYFHPQMRFVSGLSYCSSQAH